MIKRALIIDDNEQCRALISDFLELYSFEVVTFPDPVAFLNLHGDTCCRQSTTPCFDIILTDNYMPGMQGIDFLELIENSDCFLRGAAKAVISGHWTEEDLNRAQQLGCETFHKPDLSDLLAWLEGFKDGRVCSGESA